MVLQDQIPARLLSWVYWRGVFHTVPACRSLVSHDAELLPQVSGRTALHTDEQKFDLMYEHLRDLKDGKTVMKPIYNHVNGTLDTPEEIKPTPIVIIEGLHPFVDKRVRDLLDFTIYLDISDEIKFAWKIQRDMKERGHSLESIKASIEVQ